MHRLKPDEEGRLYLKGHGGHAVPVRIAMIETTALRELDQRFMASNHGGEIAVRETAEGELVPIRALYRIRFRLETDALSIHHVGVGDVRISAKPESFLQPAWRRVIGVLCREMSCSVGTPANLCSKLGCSSLS